MASEEEGSTSNKDTNSGHEIQKYIQEEMSKILQKMSSTSLVKSGESFAFTTYSGTTPMNNNWILDTGATDHMSPHKSIFQTYTQVDKNHRVFTTNGGVLMVGGKGTIILKGITLKNVLHVPDLKANLMSLAQLVIDTGWRFILDSESCFLCVKATGMKISSVKKRGGLLILDELEEHTPRQVVYSTQSD